MHIVVLGCSQTGAVAVFRKVRLTGSNVTISMDPLVKLDGLIESNTEGRDMGRFSMDIGIVERKGEGQLANLTDNYVMISRFEPSNSEPKIHAWNILFLLEKSTESG